MTALRKGIGERINLYGLTQNVSSASVTGVQVYTYDPNPTGEYDSTKEAILEISITPQASFSHTANSFKYQLQQYNSAGSTVGSAIVLWDATATDGTAYVPIGANPNPQIQLSSGDSISFDCAKANSGTSSVPAVAITMLVGQYGA